MFVARHLRRNGSPHEGVAYEFRDTSDRVCIKLSAPKWIGLNVSLFTNLYYVTEPDLYVTEPDLQVPLLDAILLEEIAHLWDYRLEEEGTPYYSIDWTGRVGPEWKRVAYDAIDRPKPFNIPNRRTYASTEEQNAEDWAAAVVWYVFQRDGLRRRAQEHYEFVERLFQRCLPL